MSRRLLASAVAGALVLAAAGAASAQISVQTGPKAPEGPYVGWTSEADGAARYAPAGATLPATLAGAARGELKDLDPKGTNAVAMYGQPAEGAVWTTLFVYQPGVQDLNLLALQADLAARAFSDAGAGQADTVAVAAGGPAVGRRVVYPAHDGVVNGLALARAGTWVIKARASGPDAARVTAALDEALAGVRWKGDTAYAPVADLALPDCPAEPKRKPAKQAQLDMTETLMALAGATAAEEIDAKDGADATPERACRVAGTFSRQTPFSIIHYSDPETSKRTRTLVLLGDAGGALEVARTLDLGGGKPKYYLGMRDRAGSLALHGAFKDWPTDQQLLDLFK